MGNLYQRVISSPQIEAVFSDETLIAAMLRFEACLARAQASTGLIPQATAELIVEQAQTLQVDRQRLVLDGATAGSIAIPLVNTLTSQVARHDGHASRFVHYGATSQDVLDSALALCTQSAMDLIEIELERCTSAAAALARQHAQVAMLARTLLQPAGVTTMGCKAAQWALALTRGRERLSTTARTALAVSLGGAAGDLARHGDLAADVRAALADALGLHDPGFTWHTQRDSWLALATDAALTAGSMAKIARDISLLAQHEVGEVEEPQAESRGGSTAMPHKRNPVLCLRIIAATQPIPGFIANLLAAMPQEHERALGNWQAEIAQWPEVFVRTYDAAYALAELLEGLRVDPPRCLLNIEALRGVVFADQLADLLGSALGRGQALELVGDWCRRAREQNLALQDLALAAIKSDSRLTGYSTRQVTACFSVTRAAQASLRMAETMLASL